MSSTVILGSVIVPVLSTQSVSTRASVSMQPISWTSVRRLASRITLATSARLVSRYSPSGIMPTIEPTVEVTASATGLLSHRYSLMNMTAPQRNDQKTDPLDEARERAHHLRLRLRAGLPGLDRQAGDEAVRADLRQPRAAAAAHDKAAGEQRVARALDDLVGLTGDERLVDAALARGHNGVRRDLVAGAEKRRCRRAPARPPRSGRSAHPARRGISART